MRVSLGQPSTPMSELPPHEPCGPTPATEPSAGGSEAMLQTFLQQQGRMEKQLSRWVACRATAADLVQELFIRLWRRKDVQVEDLGQYMMRSARNLAIDHLRSQRSRLRTESALLPEQMVGAPSAVEDGHQADHDLHQVDAALRTLPERTRHVFLLNRIHGQSYSEIAGALGISASAVEKHMMRALQVCKDSIDMDSSSRNSHRKARS
ncbi:MAG: RNA polymerase sigma factor [Janthinobacterium lividum]